jgi:hypothetical protein
MADKIVADYIVKTDEAVKNLNRLEKEVKDLQNQGKKSAKDIESNFKKTSGSLISQFSKVGAAIGVAFGAAELISFGKEAVNVAAKAEGIERAFNKLNNPNLLADLRKATRGTVSDLELMQKAVQANNFKLPLDQLAKLFKFATDRAIETGESVDYLVESIVLGISRKSIPILDNLGISSVQIQEEMRKTGDFAQAAFNIVEQSMADAGDVADTTAVQFAQMQTSWENFKLLFGSAIISTGVISELKKVIDTYVIALRVAQGETLETIEINEGAEEAIASFANNAKRSLEKLIKPLEDGKENTEALTKANETLADSERKLNALINRKAADERTLLLLEKQLEETNPFNKLQRIELEKSIDNTKTKIALDNLQVKQVKALISVYDNYVNGLNGANDAENNLIENLKFYNDLIEELQTKQKDANTTRAEVRQLEDEINEAIRQRLILLGRLREVGGASMQEIETIAASELEVQQTLTDDILADYAHRNGEIEAAQDKLNQSLEQKRLEQQEKQLQDFSTYANEISNIFSAVAQIQQNLNQEELTNLQTQLDEGIISREEYEVKRKQILTQQAEDQKAFAVFDSAINGSLAVVNAFADGGPILAAIVAAAVAAQVAAIASAPTPQFAEGGLVKEHGLLKGKSHAKGGIQVEAEGDEFFVNKKATKKNLSLLKAINNGVGQEWINKNMVYPAIQNVIDSGVESNSGNWGNVTASLKDHNIIAGLDRLRQSQSYGFKFLAKELKSNNRRRGGYA